MLLRPTQIYVSLTRQVLGHYKVKNVVHGIAHITGGGLLENAQRVLNKRVDLVLERDAWEIPKEFQWLQSLGEVDEAEMFRVFNMGIGLVLIVSPYYVKTVVDIATQLGLQTWQLGNAIEGTGICRWAQ